MMVLNQDVDNYFVIAIAPYRFFKPDGKEELCVHRGAAFRWKYKIIDDAMQCLTCNGIREVYGIIGPFHCDENFKDEEGNEKIYEIPANLLIETYDVNDEDIVTESWWHETGGYNKDLFTPPHLREEYEGWRQGKP